MEKLRQTPSQTVGPFFAYSLTAQQYGYDFSSIVNESLISEDTHGERIFIQGNVLDGNGDVILDAMVELYQQDLLISKVISDKYPIKLGFGRMGTGTDAQRRFCFTTLKPQAQIEEAPHINVILFMRGSLRHLYTRLYFSDQEADNKQDKVLNLVPTERRNTLIAQRKEQHGQVFYEFNIRMQGEDETVFFEI